MKPDRPRVTAGLSLALASVVGTLYAAVPDWAAAVTIWPPWVWALPGLLLVGLAWHREHPRPARGAALGWVVFLLLLMEEPRSVARGLLPAATAPGAIRVVSLNCAGGSAEAAAEALIPQPEVVLLQETPGRKEVAELARRLGPGSGHVWAVDTSILVRGQIREIPVRPRVSHFVAGTARLETGPAVTLVSLRLTPPVVRFELWAPDAWREYTENRRARRREVEELAGFLNGAAPDGPLLVGGDFNAPAGDAIYRLLRPRLRDAFAVAGRGWGNTALNDIPVSRIDQVWASDAFRPTAVTARRTAYSDHRMVVADLQLGAR